VNWTTVPGDPAYLLTFYNDEIFEVFTFDFGETSKTISGLRADTVYQADIFAYLGDGSETGSATGEVRTLAG